MKEKAKIAFIGLMILAGLLLGCNDWDGMDRSGDAWEGDAYLTSEPMVDVDK